MTVLHKRLGLLLVMTVVCAAVPQATPPPTVLPIGSATVTDLKGEITLHSPNGGALTVQRGLVLDPASTIETSNGSILLSLQDGSQVLVKSHSRIVLTSPEVGIGSYLELLVGKLVAKVQKRLGETHPFRLGTPSAVITVRGTRFEVEVTKKRRTYVRVFEGRVEVQALMTGGRSVFVPPGSSTEVDPDRDPQPPRSLIEDMRDSDARTNNSQGREIGGPGHETEQPGHEGTREPQNNGGRPD